MAASTVLVFIAIGFAYNQLSTEVYEATAEIIVQDPRADTLLNVASPELSSTMSSERNLADQVSILESTEVAKVASDSLDGELSPQYILSHSSVSGSGTSNLIQVVFRADDPAVAKTGADALVDAYLEVRRSQIQDTADLALGRVDALQEALDEELAGIQDRIDAAVSDDEAHRELNAQMDEATVELNELRVERDAAAPGSDERAVLNSQIDEIMSDFAGWETVLEIERQESDLAQLLAERDAAIAERAALTGRRNSIAVNAELAAGGVTLASPAPTPSDPAGISPMIVLAGMAVLGLATAAALAFYLAQRRRVIIDRATPETIVGAPLLAVVPDLASEGPHLTVSKAGDSLGAEAFRFASSAIATRASLSDVHSVLFTAATGRSGTTTILANTAMAAALSGKRVVVLDADFASQRLSRLLGVAQGNGMAEVADGAASLAETLATVNVGNQNTLSVLQRGKLQAEASSFFNRESTAQMLRELAESFDLVLIDAPALLEVAYVSTLARAADAAVVVVRDGTAFDSLDEAVDRLDLLGTPRLGYIYSQGEIRAESRRRSPTRSSGAQEQTREPETVSGSVG